MMEIALRGKKGEGKFALVDDEDFEYLNQFKWSLGKDGYAIRCFREGGKTKSILMHRELLNLENVPNIKVDHIFHDKLDNRKEMLRLCSTSQNGMNRVKQNRPSSSIYKGVFFHSIAKKWQAQIRYNKKVKNLGLYLTEEEAAKAYNEKAKELFGEFALLNEIKDRGI